MNPITNRAYRLTFAELIDRLNIVIQKIIFAEDEEQKSKFIVERREILHDIDLFIEEGVNITGNMINAMLTLQLINYTIWINEDEERKETKEEDSPNWEQKYKRLRFTHGLNANRAGVKKFIQESIGGRIDYKLNYISGIWDIKL